MERAGANLMVFDTMVFAYALLQVEDQCELAMQALESAEEIIVPDSMFTELGNVVWQWIQFRSVSLAVGLDVLADAEALVDRVIVNAQLRELALELAVGAEHSFYDAVFVAAAVQQETTVMTFNRKLALKFPEQVQLLN